MEGPITVGYDGSPESVAAAEWAAREAELRGVGLQLLLAWPWSADHVLGTPAATAESRGRLGLQEAALRDRLSGVEVSAVHRPGLPGETLAAAGLTSSMLVLGSGRLPSLRGFLIGAVGRHVVAVAHCPVVLVRAPQDPLQAAGEVVLGLDLDHRCDPVVHFAFESAALRTARLRVVHAWQPPVEGDLAPSAAAGLDRELADETTQRFTDALTPWREKYPDVEVVASLLRGSAPATVVEAAGRPDLLVIGRRSRTGILGSYLGPVTSAAVHHIGSPLAVVPYA